MVTQQPKARTEPRWKGLGLRIFSMVPLLAVVITCILLGDQLFVLMMIAAAFIMLKEYEAMLRQTDQMLRVFGYLGILYCCYSFMWLRGFAEPPKDEVGISLVFSLIAIIAATDIGAYFTGKCFGKHKLAPLISPGKTWEGLFGGAACAMYVANLTLFPIMPVSHSQAALIGLGIALLAQAGDLMESWFKRRAGIKDSGNLLPGHGGLLDRVDGYLLTAPAFAILVNWYGL